MGDRLGTPSAVVTQLFFSPPLGVAAAQPGSFLPMSELFNTLVGKKAHTTTTWAGQVGYL